MSHIKLEKLFLDGSEILELLVNTLTAVDEYSCHDREKLPLPIQIEISKKFLKICGSFIAFLKLTLNFEHFEENMSLIA